MPTGWARRARSRNQRGARREFSYALLRAVAAVADRGDGGLSEAALQSALDQTRHALSKDVIEGVSERAVRIVRLAVFVIEVVSCAMPIRSITRREGALTATV